MLLLFIRLSCCIVPVVNKDNEPILISKYSLKQQRERWSFLDYQQTLQALGGRASTTALPLAVSLREAEDSDQRRNPTSFRGGRVCCEKTRTGETS